MKRIPDAAGRIACAVAATTAIACTPALAADKLAGGFPTKPVRLIVPYAPGGGNDTMARAIGARLSEAWGQQVVIDNRPGANGLLACQMTAQSAPDGYTLLMANVASHAINPALYKKLPYDAVKEFTPVSLLGIAPNALVVHPTVAATNVNELIALAKQKPGQLTYGSNGTGSSQHLAGVMFGQAFGVELLHIPYKGTAPALVDLLGGQTSLSFSSILSVLQYIKANRLRALAVTSLKRSPTLPNAPALAEVSPGFEAVTWWGIVGPARMSADLTNGMSAEIVKQLNTAAMKEQLDRLGVEGAGNTSPQFAKFINTELTRWGKVVKASGAQAE